MDEVTLKMLTVDHKSQFCPVCFELLDAMSALTGDAPPEAGDFTICLYCRSILRVCEDFGLAKSSLMEIPTHSRFTFAKALRLMDEMPPPRRKREPFPKA